jgi:radical SAM protein with 4Fe4S-binding SPASM domain
MLHEKLFKQVIDEIAPDLHYLIFYFQGEPYLNPNFLDLVEYAHSKKIYTATSTNGHFLDNDNAQRTIESGLDRLIISIDGTTQETYESYRKGGSLEQVLEGARNIVRWKEKLNSKTPHTIFQFLVVRPNEHQIDEVYELADELGIDEVKLKTAQIYDYKNGSPLIPKNEKYSRYRQRPDGTYEIKNNLHSHCWKLWHACVITWDGKVVPCCFDKDAKYQLGNLQKQSFSDLWNSKPYRQFRHKVLQSRQNIDICQNCTEGTKVWI